MSKFVEEMTFIPSHSHPSQENNSVDKSSEGLNPIVALKELVANLQRETKQNSRFIKLFGICFA